MKYRLLGNTGISISEIGFGAWGIGGYNEGQMSYGHVPEEQALEAINVAIDSGVTFFDTSPLYGLGRSELLIGQAIRYCRDQVVIASKVGLDNYNILADFTPKSMARSLNETLKRLGTDYVDLLQLHDPEIALLDHSPEIFESLQSFKDSGKIRAFGISVRSPKDALIAIRDYEFSTVQVNFNMLDQRAVDCGLFDIACSTKTGIIVRTPLCLGFLVGDFDENILFSSEDHRNRWEREQIIRWVRSAKIILSAVREAGEDGSNTELALRYCLSFRGVSTVIPGPLNRLQASINARAGDVGMLSKNACEKARQVYLAWEQS